MADPVSYSLTPRLDVEQLFVEAQHRWLRPAEICEILRNYQKFQISSEPPDRPSSGSLFLFDRKVLRYFRKDGHNWRKKKDGKTVKEAHEKLKVGSVDVLHCYYAHGEENENFQRRSYWMLEQELMHIVFVHYLEVKGNRTSGSQGNSFSVNHNKEPSGHTDSTSPTSTLSSACEDADSADSHLGTARYGLPQVQNNSVMDIVNVDGMWGQPQIRVGQPLTSGVGTVSCSHADRGGDNNYITGSQSLGSWQGVLEQVSTVYNGSPSNSLGSSTQPLSLSIGGSMTSLGEISIIGIDAKENFDASMRIQSNWQIPPGRSSFHLSDDSLDPTLGLDFECVWDSEFFEKRPHDAYSHDALHSFCSVPDQQNHLLGQDNDYMPITSKEIQEQSQSNFQIDKSVEGNGKYPLVKKKSLLTGEEGLQKVDSFSRWVTKELGEVDDLNMKPSSAIAWSSVECGNVMDDSSLSPSLSQDQLFSIIDFSPKWSYINSEAEVHIIGTFLKGQEEVEKCHWSCMFGEVEVPAEVITDGVLCCRSPCHDVATVPFYITNSNRVACSEVREFDYRMGYEDVNVIDMFSSTTEMHLYLQLGRLLSARSSSSLNIHFDGATEKRKLIGKLISLKEEDENYQSTESTSLEDFSGDELKQQFLQNQLKEKLYSWLLHKVTESGKGPSILDDDGQGALHLCAALGFGWAMKPMVTAGVNINFRDANGWTALHWAAFYGREKTVAVLVALGAATGLLTDPSPENPLGRTPADLASANGHKGISGFLAESSLTRYLSDLTVKDPKEDGYPDSLVPKAVQTVTERTATPVHYGDVQEELSLKDSLTAVCNATQAASRIYQVFRMQSFQRKQVAEYNDENLVTSNECTLSFIASMTSKSGHSDGIVHAAAVQIQKRYRGWKKRKEFLIIRQRIVKLQAHVRGHQVRKKYKTIIWSVGILEKVILRWRRKGSGLRGFRRDVPADEPSSEIMPPKEDDYDFLKEGRKQNEKRMQHALNRVKSMIHYPEGRAQYRRLLTVVGGFREAQETDMVLSNSEAIADGDEDLLGIDSLLDDDTFMSMAFE